MMSIKNDNNTPRLFAVEEYFRPQRKETETYEDFVAKFKPKPKPKPKNGSDECYTPTNVYECVYTYVRELFPQFNNMENLRPFKPNGDFTREDYNNRIVIDNPPFSMLSNIVNFYQLNNIKFWLFGPTLTIMQYYGRYDIVITKTNIRYANGANIPTSFITNMFGDDRIVLDGVLTERLNLSQNMKKTVIKNKYPYVLSSSRLMKWVELEKVIVINKEDTLPIISSKYKPFGNGCYVREGVLPSINADTSKLTDEEFFYLCYNNFNPIC